MDSRPVLLRLRLRGRIPHPRDADTAALVAAGLATEKAAQLLLSPAGRAAAEAEFRRSGDDEAAVRSAYDKFLPRNAEVIRVCHDWQAHPGEWTVIDRLAGIDDKAGPNLRRLGTRVEEFGGYRARLRHARKQVEEGERDWFTSPRIDSYHTVWMELHEHLLLALGLDRATESVESTG
jgi:hypothetical protein